MVKRLWLLALLSQASCPAVAGKDLSESDFLSEPPAVLTASRMAQSVMDAPNAVTVLDRETIVSSGYTRIADLMRLVPGMFVGEMSGWDMKVSHSFVDQLERRMQVMIDGRSVYLPTHGGVDWDSLPLAIDDIERIEVVRGPNAASYGANAFTGIINIITRHPADVSGRMLMLMHGTQDLKQGWFRWAASNERLQQRITLGHKEDGGQAHQQDDALTNLLNYRADVALGHGQGLSLQVSASDGSRQDQGPDKQLVSAYSLQLDYRRQIDEGRALQVKFYDSRLINKEYKTTASGFAYIEDQSGLRRHLEVQFDHQNHPDLRTTVGGYLRQDIVQSWFYFNSEADLQVDSNGLFGVLEWRLAPQWLLNAGGFFENYSLVGGKFSPRLVVNWQPNENHTLRAGISRAYRNPVLYEDSGVLRSGSLVLPVGEQNLQPESMLSRELGYLARWPELHLNLDLRLFRDQLQDYIGLNLGTFSIDNWGSAEQTGGEVQLRWHPYPHTQVIANYAEFHIDSAVTNNDTVGESAPRHLASLHLMHRLPYEIDAYLAQQWISRLTPINESRPVPFHRALDIGLHKHFQLSGRSGVLGISWQNLSGSYYSLESSARNLVERRAAMHIQLEF